MNLTLIAAFLQHRLSSPLRMLFLAAFVLMPLLFVTAAPGMGLTPLEDSFWFVIVLGAGAIGQDVSSGVLQLLLARPITRPEYVTSRWLAVAIGAGCDFLTPIGHQCNTLVMGPGGYRFGDYWRLGLPLSILVILIAVPLLLVIWPVA